MSEDLGFHKHGNYIWFDTEQFKTIKQRYLNGETAKDIAHDLGICADTVRRRLKDGNVSLKPGNRKVHLTKEQIAKLVRMRDGGHPWKTICKQFDRGDSYLRRLYTEAKVGSQAS